MKYIELNKEQRDLITRFYNYKDYLGLSMYESYILIECIKTINNSKPVTVNDDDRNKLNNIRGKYINFILEKAK